MFCTKCGNKLQPNTKTCKFCGYEMTIEDDEEVANIVEVKPIEKNKISNTKNTDVNKSNQLFIIFSILLIVIPFILTPLAYIGYKLTALFFVCLIIAIFIELLGIYMLNNLLENKKNMIKISKYTTYLGFLTLVFSLTIILVAFFMDSMSIITQYQNIVATLICIGTFSLTYSGVSLLLVKYS